MPTNEGRAIEWLRKNNKCASKSPSGHLCTLTINHTDKPHKAQVLGGIDDGKTLAEWPW